MSDAYRDQVAAEQAHVTRAYRRLDTLRHQARERLDQVRRGRAGGSPQNRSERDSFAALHSDRLAQLESVEDRLVFGRLDLTDGETRHIGRIGLQDGDLTALLTDWRAPAAEPFYQATSARRLGVRLRRHITTTGRQVTAIEDELLDVAADPGAAAALSGEGALMAALAAGRTGHMGDIVATIQAEQDRIIRSDLAGALVVQGGPGTGKTAVALHRAAYLLYSHREQLAARGVLVVGPSRIFLRYIDRVLPSLGETGVVASTLGDLIPGLSVERPEEPAVAAIKGRAEMADVVKAAVLERQRLPRRDIVLKVLGRSVVLRRADVVAARGAARTSGKPYNQARVVFVKQILERLAAQMVQQLGDGLVAEDYTEVVQDLRAAREVRTAVNLCWMPMTPEHLIADLYAKPYLLEHCAPQLTAAERAMLVRPAEAPWTVADVPLLDEAAELLGEDDQAAQALRREEAARRRREIEYARGVLSLHGIEQELAERVVDRFADQGPSLTVAERAGADRSWTYGHIVVDEAQELSPMDWRMLLRRCPSRSLTIVGDAGQTRAAGAAGTWEASLGPVLGPAAGRTPGRTSERRGAKRVGPKRTGAGWRLEQLTVNYRTPGAVVRAAQAMARAAGLPVGSDTAARDVEDAFTVMQVADPVAEAVALATRYAPEGPAGRLAIVLAPGEVAAALEAIRRSPLAARVARPGENPLDLPVAVLAAGDTKGLEFDYVLIVEPAHIVGDSADPLVRRAGAADLYVAMTRPTQRLWLLYSADLPPFPRESTVM
ncbi:MAG: AAA family ATPase [Bifidobacteriaceae bacterium]|nr:AAA family ATPase [Bifidobacteriaceae bacterium]